MMHLHLYPSATRLGVIGYVLGTAAVASVAALDEAWLVVALIAALGVVALPLTVLASNIVWQSLTPKEQR